MKPTVILTAALMCAISPNSLAKPLKVYILAGQANMERHAAVSTFDYIGKGVWNHSGITLDKFPSMAVTTTSAALRFSPRWARPSPKRT